MQTLIDVLEQLNPEEREDFMSWFSSLKSKYQKAVRIQLEDTTPDHIRLILSVPNAQRIALFSINKNIFDEIDDQIQGSGIIAKGEEIKKKQRDTINALLKQLKENK